MSAAPRNLAFPIFLLVALAFVLLLFLLVWLWGGSGTEGLTGDLMGPGEQTAEQRTNAREDDRRQDAESPGQPMPDAAAEYGAEAEKDPVATDPESGGDRPAAQAGRAVDGNNSAREAARRAPLPSPGGDGGTTPTAGGSPGIGAGGGTASSPSSSSSERQGAGMSGGATEGSTFVAIPAAQHQAAATPAPPESSPAAEPESEIAEEPPTEEEGAPEPLSEPPTETEPERQEPEPQQEPQDSTPIVQLIPAATELAVGEQLAVAVMISGASDVGHVPFHLLFDPQVLQFEYGVEGPFLSSDGRQTAFFAAPASGGGAVVVGLSRLGRGDGISGGGELCVLNFTAIGAGQSALTFSREKVRDSANRIVQSVFIPVAVNVH